MGEMIAPQETCLELAARTFAASRSACDRERVREAALPLVRRIAAGVLRRLPTHFTTDDLIGDGCVGLLRAVDRFNPSHGILFEAWAARIVRGAMLNGLRRMDVIPERVRRDARTLDAARWRIAQRDGAAPSDCAAAENAGLNIRKLDGTAPCRAGIAGCAAAAQRAIDHRRRPRGFRLRRPGAMRRTALGARRSGSGRSHAAAARTDDHRGLLCG